MEAQTKEALQALVPALSDSAHQVGRREGGSWGAPPHLGSVSGPHLTLFVAELL